MSALKLFSENTTPIQPLRELTLDDLWREAESLGAVRIYTHTKFDDVTIIGYDVKIVGKKRNSKIEVERRHSSLHCAFADCINEAREMGLGQSE